MISGIIMSLVVIWVYQTLIKEKKGNLLYWVVGCAALFFATLALADFFCVEIIQGLKTDISDQYDPSIAAVGDRKTSEAAGGSFLSVICELLPTILGVLAVAVVRTLLITKQALTPANLFSGIKEMFASIKDSFKTTSN
jgi:hypothetical protein